ncbi:MAG: SDR family NAD(P)-dependent oxidoreductase [Bdellovibrionia bacterium]
MSHVQSDLKAPLTPASSLSGKSLKRPSLTLQGHRALVTGASSGIGEAFARELASRGSDLVITARRESRLQTLAQQLRQQYGVQVDCVVCDLAQPDSAQRLYQQATAGGKSVQILMNNAGVGPYGEFLSGGWEGHAATLQLNATSLSELCYRFSSHMISQARPCYLVNIASIAAFQGSPNFAVYAGTKAFNRIFSEILAFELKSTQVSVTCVCPGGTYTEFLEKNGQVLKEAGHSAMMTAEEVARIGIEGMLRRKTVVVPGLLNQVACFLPRLLPRAFALKLAQVAMNRSVSKQSGSAPATDSSSISADG